MLGALKLKYYLHQGGFSLYHIYSIIKDNYFCQVMLAHLPLTLVCLDGLGNLSEKHPVMAQQAVSCLRYLSLTKIVMVLLLRDFLINPSDILTHLYSSGQKTAGLNHPEIKGVIPIYIYTAR